MKKDEPSIGTLKRSRREAFTIAPAPSAMPATKETLVDPIAAMDPSGGANDVDPTIAPLLPLRVMIESFMTTQAAHG
nr:hypothetical protein CFP56_76682 [Quercus suber]